MASHNNDVNVPQWLATAAVTFFVILLGVWVKAAANDEAKAMVDDHIRNESRRHEVEEAKIISQGERVTVVETRVDSLSAAVNAVKDVARANQVMLQDTRELLVRIATKLDVATDYKADK